MQLYEFRKELRMNKARFWTTIVISILCCGVMMLTDGVWTPCYAVKSVIKIALFLGLPYLASLVDKGMMFRELFKVKKQGFKMAFILGIALFGLILGAYSLFSKFVDFSGIVTSLEQNVGVDKGNFMFVALYVSLVNSMLEEFFFRGFVFGNVKQSYSRKAAYLYSSFLFAAYHVTMMVGWFPTIILVLVIASLMVGGMIFNYLNEKYDTILVSWFVHMFANFSINTIGFILMK